MPSVFEYPTARQHMAAAIVAATALNLVPMALQVGTGGAQTAEFYRQRGDKGYGFALYVATAPIADLDHVRTPSENLEHVRTVLKPSVTDLAAALGVSRQAIYDWQAGKSIAPQNAARLADLAAAADVLSSEKLTVTAQLLRRPIAHGKRFFDLVRDGGCAEDAARQLAQTARREFAQRQALSERLSGRERPSTLSEDLVAPLMDEVG